MEEFNVGDTVMLKSGGPVMTVYSQTNVKELYCVWFDNHEKFQSANFAKETLKRYHFPIK